MELISREEAIQKIREMPIEYFGRSLTRKSVVKAELEELPIIESRPKGKWIKNEYDWYYHCSVCKENNLLHTDESNALSNYCHNCGADMRGEE